MSTEETPQEMNQGQAVNVLIQAARIAQAKGAFTLEDAELVSKAIKVFVPPTDETEGETETDSIVNEGAPMEPVIEKVK